MKKRVLWERGIILLVFISLLSSCNHRKAGDILREEQARQDSIARAEAIQDSLMKAEVAPFVWGDLPFGISQKEAIKYSCMGKKPSSYPNSITPDHETIWDLSNSLDLQHGIGNFDFFFKNDELYALQIKSYSVNASYIEQLEDECIKFGVQFQKKMGAPIYIKNEVSIFDFKHGEEFLFLKYKADAKAVFIKLGEDQYSSEYYYRIWVQNDNYPTVTAEDLEQEKEKQKEKEEILNNAF